MGEQNNTQQQKLVHKFSQARAKIARNKLIFVTVLNVLSFCSFIFAMAFYQWAQVAITVKPCVKHPILLWINLLYIYDVKSNKSYETFDGAQGRLCFCDQQSNQYCKSVLNSFNFVGHLCFGIFCIAGLLQIYDFARVLWILCKKQNSELERKQNFRQIITIFTYLIGVTLSVYGLIMTIYLSEKPQYAEYLNLNFQKYGISFWLCVSTLIIFIGVTIYQQISIRRVIKQKMIKNLLDKQMQSRNKTLKKQNKPIEVQMSGQYQVNQDILTI